MKKLFLLCAAALMMSVVCCKKGDEPTPAAHAPTAAFVWDGVYYCASFYNESTGDTICRKVVTAAQFDSLAYNYGAHLWCTYPSNTGVGYSGKQINTSSECH